MDGWNWEEKKRISTLEIRTGKGWGCSFKWEKVDENEDHLVWVQN